VIGHLGARVSALLDGQLPAAEAERLWAHVHACHACRDLVEREGWIKTRLAGLPGAAPAPDHLKGSLLGPGALGAPVAARHDPGALRRHTGLAVLGGGAVGVAVIGVVALGLAGPDAPVDRRPPVTDIGQNGGSRTVPTSVVPTPLPSSPHRRSH
jgi:anti-sigma factor RsiW